MGPIQQSIYAKLKDQFGPSHLEVINESGSHNVPEGSETHFKLIIVSESFLAQSRVKRQQSVYRVLQQELDGPVHALSMTTMTDEEWKKSNGQTFDSPRCRGGEG